MSLKSDQIPNKPLNGQEILELAVQDFRAMLAKDCMLTRGIAYRRAAYTLTATFHLGNPHPAIEFKSRTKANGVIEGEVPLSDPPEDAVLVALERDVDNDNPNLARVHHDLPIKLQERMPPPPPQISQIPGEPPLTESVMQFPEIRNTEIRYDKTQYPEAKPPVDRDVSEAAAAKLGVKSGMGLRERKK